MRMTATGRPARSPRAVGEDPVVLLVECPLQALADPARLNLALALLDGQERCVGDLSWDTQRAQESKIIAGHLAQRPAS